MELNIGDYVRTKNKSFQPSQIAKIYKKLLKNVNVWCKIHSNSQKNVYF